METGFESNGGLVQYGQDNTSENWEYLVCSNIPLRILISSDLPVDKDGLPMDCSFYNGDIPLFSAKGSWGTQGQSSLAALKKNWKLKLKNRKTDNKLKIKFEKWLPMSSITLKGYGTDRTLLRDSLSTELWRQIYCTHYDGLLAPNAMYNYFTDKNYSSLTSATFSTEGFPIEIYRNDNFMGIYVIRCDNSAISYLIDKDNPKHLLMGVGHDQDFWTSGEYHQGNWESFASPIENHTAQMTSFLRWAADCVAGKVDIKSTYKDYINLESWIDYIILIESVVNYDSITNNFTLASYDSKIIYIYPYDFDQSFGISPILNNVGFKDQSKIGWVMRKNSGAINADQDIAFFETLSKAFHAKIRERYYFLRNNNILSEENLSKMIKKQVDRIDPELMSKDRDLYSINGATGLGTGTVISNNGIKWSFVYVREFFSYRLKWLDQQFNI